MTIAAFLVSLAVRIETKRSRTPIERELAMLCRDYATIAMLLELQEAEEQTAAATAAAKAAAQ